jgi:nucleoside-diphosphate-sugar epimerase
MTSRVLATGASGFVGRAICVQAVCQGLVVRGALRKHGELPDSVEPVVVGEINGATNWGHALDEVNVVIHLAARVHVMHDTSADPLAEFRKVNVQGTENLARQAARAGVKRLVYVSSIKVNGETTSSEAASALAEIPPSPPFAKGGVVRSQRVRAVFRETDVPDLQDPYGISKWEAEQVLYRVAKETGLEVVIVRPPLVYGAGVKGNFAQMLKVLAKGTPLPLASIRNLRSLVYVENLVDALILCGTHPAAAGQTYLVSDGEDVSTPDLLRQLGMGMGCPARLFRCPLPLLKIAGRFAGKSDQVERLLGSLQVDSSKIRRELGWKPPYTLQQGLQETAQWYRNAHAHLI